MLMHMLIGIVLMTVLIFMVPAKRFSAGWHNPVEIIGLYWHFVDTVWVFLFPHSLPVTESPDDGGTEGTSRRRPAPMLPWCDDRDGLCSTLTIAAAFVDMDQWTTAHGALVPAAKHRGLR